MLEARSVYPRLNANARVHLHPGGSHVYLALPQGERRDAVDIEVAEWATPLVRQCDGTLSLRDLALAAIGSESVRNGEMNVEVVLAEFGSLIAGLVDHDFVELLQHPSPLRVVVSGNTARFSPMHASIELTDHCNCAFRPS
jgi:hypothetical protein